jgi:glycosyltransferase involved in cell wall biosynthesis
MRLSILVPTYERPALLAEALRSIAMQDRSIIHEILIGDDSSPEMSELNKHCIEASDIKELTKYQSNCPRLGQYPNIWAMAERARGSHLLLLHDDDLLAPDGLRKLTEACVGDSGMGRVRVWFGRNAICDGDGVLNEQAGQRAMENYGKASSDQVKEMWRWTLKHALPPNCFLIDREIYLTHCRGLSDQNVGDFGLSVRLSNAGVWAHFIDKEVSIYRVHENSETGSMRGVDVHCILELLKQLNVPAEGAAEKRAFIVKICQVATARYIRDGQRARALCSYWEDWGWRQRFSFRGVATLVAFATPGFLLRALAEIRRELTKIAGSGAKRSVSH